MSNPDNPRLLVWVSWFELVAYPFSSAHCWEKGVVPPPNGPCTNWGYCVIKSVLIGSSKFVWSKLLTTSLPLFFNPKVVDEYVFI